MLKFYFDRSDIVSNLNCAVIDYAESEDYPVDNFLDLSSSDNVNDIDINPELADAERSAINNLLREFSCIFSDDPGLTNLCQHEIRLTDETPIRVKDRFLPFSMRQAVTDEVQKMLDKDIVEPSNSPYSFPLVMVRKKDSSLRPCVDFRALNRICVFDAETTPDVDYMLAKVGKFCFYSKFDISKGIMYHFEKKTVNRFQTPLGLMQFKVMPFGLLTSQATFTKAMRETLAKMKRRDNVENIIDDMLVFTMTFEEHLLVLRELFTQILHANLTIA